MDMGMSFVTNLQAPEGVELSNRAFHDPARFAEPTALGRADFGEHRRDAATAQALSVWFGIVTPVALNDFRPAQRASALSPYGGNRLDQRIELCDVVAIRAAQDDGDRDALRIDDEVMLATEHAPVHWIRISFFPANMARTEELSTMARAMSSGPRRRNSASSVSWMRC